MYCILQLLCTVTHWGDSIRCNIVSAGYPAVASQRLEFIYSPSFTALLLPKKNSRLIMSRLYVTVFHIKRESPIVSFDHVSISTLRQVAYWERLFHQYCCVFFCDAIINNVHLTNNHGLNLHFITRTSWIRIQHFFFQQIMCLNID